MENGKILTDRHKKYSKRKQSNNHKKNNKMTVKMIIFIF